MVLVWGKNMFSKNWQLSYTTDSPPAQGDHEVPAGPVARHLGGSRILPAPVKGVLSQTGT